MSLNDLTLSFFMERIALAEKVLHGVRRVDEIEEVVKGRHGNYGGRQVDIAMKGLIVRHVSEPSCVLQVSRRRAESHVLGKIELDDMEPQVGSAESGCDNFVAVGFGNDRQGLSPVAAHDYMDASKRDILGSLSDCAEKVMDGLEVVFVLHGDFVRDDEEHSQVAANASDNTHRFWKTPCQSGSRSRRNSNFCDICDTRSRSQYCFFNCIAAIKGYLHHRRQIRHDNSMFYVNNTVFKKDNEFTE